LSSYFFS
jgi:hypothetical protein